MVKVLVIDDIRVARPVGDVEFVHARHPLDGLREVYTKQYDEIWLDHDMGYDETGARDTREIANHLDADPFFDGYTPTVCVHTMNPIGRANLVDILRKFDPITLLPTEYSTFFEKEF